MRPSNITDSLRVLDGLDLALIGFNRVDVAEVIIGTTAE